MSRQAAHFALVLLPLLASHPPQLEAGEAPAGLVKEAPANTDPKWEAAALKKRSAVSTTPGAIVCIGSSHMANWKSFQTDLKPLTVFNLGIGGSKMVHAADIFVPLMVIPAKPRAVILYEGSNDLSAGDSPETILEHFRNLHHRLHSELPETRLYVLGIVPSPGKRFERWDAIQKTNALLNAECEAQPWMRFLDTTTPLIGSDGLPRPECFIPNDPHMTAKGYERWTSVITPVVVAAEKSFEPPQAR
jgi:lysophospholipase L1-like esterase